MSPLSESDDADAIALSRTAKRARDRAQFRPTAQQKDLLVRAASLTGQTLSDFMRTAVEDRAKRVIEEHERLILSERARATFLRALANPPQPNDRLIALADRYAREVTSRP